MDSNTHRRKFEEIIVKYNFNDKDKAQDIAKYLTEHLDIPISSKEFSILFAMEEQDTIIFLSFIQKELEFKNN